MKIIRDLLFRKHLKVLSHSQPVVIWCDLFSLKELIFCLILKLFNTDIVVNYISVTRIAKKNLSILQKKGFLTWIKNHPIKFTKNRLNGEGIYPSVERLCDNVAQSFYSNMLKSNDFLPEWARNDYQYSFRLKNALKAIVASKVWNQVTVIVAARHVYESELGKHGKSRKPVFIFQAIPESYFLREILHDNVNIIYVLGFITRFWGLIKLFVAGLSLGRAKNLKTLFSKLPVASNGLFENDQGKIFVEYIATGFVGERSQIFWFKDSKIDSQRIVMYFDRSDSSASKENISIIEKKGMGWINIDNIRSLYNPLGVWIKSFKGIAQIPFPKRLKFYDMWRWLTLIKINSMIEYWRDIFRRCRVKVIIQHRESSPYQFAQSLAINLEGGIMLGYIWSSPFCKLASQCRPQDVYFVWGKLSRDWIMYNNYTTKWLLTSGYIWDNNNNKNKVEGFNIRKKFSEKVDFVMALFDESYNKYLDIGLICFYKTFLNYAMDHSNWGILIKPKGYLKWDEMPDNTINDIIRKLVQEERCIIVDPFKSPIVASTCADISIGFFINSAAVVAAINGSLSLNWDVLGCINHPFYKSKDSILVYQNIKNIIKELDKFSLKRKNNLINEGQDSLLDKIDPFRDGNAAYRVGKFIQDFMAYVDSGLSKEDALTNACNIYQKDNGEQSAINLFEDKTNIMSEDNMWYESEMEEKYLDDFFIKH